MTFERNNKNLQRGDENVGCREMITEEMKWRMSCEENSKWQSERPGEDKCRAVIETQLRLS